MKSLNNITLFLCLTISMFYTQTTITNPLLIVGKFFFDFVLPSISVGIGSMSFEGVKRVVVKKTTSILVEKASPITFKAIAAVGIAGSMAGKNYIEGQLKTNEEKKIEEEKNNKSHIVNKPTSPSV